MLLSNDITIRPVSNAPTRLVACTRCGNRAEQQLLKWEDGIFIRFAGLHVLGKWQYGYVCPYCREVSQVLTKEQAKSLRAK